MLEQVTDLGGRPDPLRLQALSERLMTHFLERRVSAVACVTTRLRGVSSLYVDVVPWLPVPRPVQPAGAAPSTLDYLLEPSAERVLERLLPLVVAARGEQILLEAFAAEHLARMTAMKQASDNADEMLDTLTLTRNKVRQAVITKELAEISGAAEAMAHA